MTQFAQWVRRHDRVTVLLILVVALGCWGFLSIADEVSDRESHAFDEQILLAMRTANDTADPLGPDWFEEAARDLTALGSVASLGIFTMVMTGYLFCTKRAWVAVFVVTAVLSGTLISYAMKSGYNRPRPALVPHETIIYTQSFPSGHSAMSSLVYLTIGAVMANGERRRHTKLFLMAVAIALMLVVGVSRVYLGVHWPTDVLAGWAFGTSWAAASWLIFRTLQRRYQTTLPPPASKTVESGCNLNTRADVDDKS